MKNVFCINIANVPLRYQFIYNETGRYFAGNIKVFDSDDFDIKMHINEFDFFRKRHPDDVSNSYIEYKGLIYLTAEELLNYNCCIFHAVSFIWNGKAWLFTGRSGIGKTTQYLNWMKMHSEEISIISGDMPMLDFRNDRIIVHPSPWNGKESIKGTIPADLGGIIILNQNTDISIEKAKRNESIVSLFKQFAIILNSKKEVDTIAKMTQRIIEEVPIWIFENDG